MEICINKNTHKDPSLVIHKKETNLLGEKKFNVDKLILSIKEKDGHALVNFIGYILSEKRKDVIKKAYAELGKEMLVALVEKTLIIENEGGISKSDQMISPTEKGKVNSNNNERKTPGGVLFKLIKDESGITKEAMKKIFVKNYKDRNERRKLIKKIENLGI
jgi:hypothetical protein